MLDRPTEIQLGVCEPTNTLSQSVNPEPLNKSEGSNSHLKMLEQIRSNIKTTDIDNQRHQQ